MDFHANILVVDDMPDIVEQITEGLGYYGQTAYAAHSGEDALAVFRETSVDVIVCDLGMPHMTGWEVGKLVREICHERGSAPPAFIMLTGWGMELDDPDRMSRSGVDVILEKPVDITKLLAVIKDVMK
jgi:CheY-like chemotaxis protein